MRDKYFESFDAALKKYEITDDNLKTKYEKRYDFGIESGLTEEEIEARLGNPEDIIREYSRDRADFKECSKYMDIEINSLYDNIEIVESEDAEYHVSFDSVDTSLYNIDKNSSSISITNTAKSYFKSKKSTGTITVSIPENAKIGDLVLSVNQGKMDICSVEAYYVDINTVSGNVLFDTIIAKEICIHTVSADISGDSVKVKKTAKLNTISGKIAINFLLADELIIDSVSGDVEIEECDAKVKSTAITGNINVGGEATRRNFKQYVKDIFKI